MPLEIIGAGFGRTGTNSLKLALEHLGYGPCHHMFEIRDNPEQLAGWEAAADGKSVDWHQVFANYRSQVDWPGARYWRELVEAFPQAKVLLSVREANGWFDSVHATIYPVMQGRGSYEDAGLNAIAEMAYKTVDNQVFDDRLNDREHAVRIFEQHIDDVRSSIPDDQLLIFDVKEGWEPLCAFLGVDVPSLPFPHTNSSTEFSEKEVPIQ